MPRYLIAFLTLLVAYSAYDWFEHVSRDGSAFARHPLAWAAFTASSVAAMIAVVMIGHRVGGRGGRAARFPVHAISVGAAFALHVTVTGPAISAMTWPHGALRFEPAAAAVVGPLAIAGLGLLRLLLPPPAAGSNSRPRPRRA